MKRVKRKVHELNGKPDLKTATVTADELAAWNVGNDLVTVRRKELLLLEAGHMSHIRGLLAKYGFTEKATIDLATGILKEKV